jgi:hypothetical protein
MASLTEDPDQGRLTAINRSFGCLNSCPLWPDPRSMTSPTSVFLSLESEIALSELAKEMRPCERAGAEAFSAWCRSPVDRWRCTPLSSQQLTPKQPMQPQPRRVILDAIDLSGRVSLAI